MSTATVTQPDERLLTAEEYAALSDERNTELVEGQVVEMPQPAFLHGNVQAEIAFLLRLFTRERDLGRVLTESGVVTTRNPDTVRGPDVSFSSYQRIPKENVPRVYAESPPEIVFEVRSPDDGVGEVHKNTQGRLERPIKSRIDKCTADTRNTSPNNSTTSAPPVSTSPSGSSRRHRMLASAPPPASRS